MQIWASSQISTNVQRTTEVVTREQYAVTQREVGRAPAEQDLLEADWLAQVI